MDDDFDDLLGFSRADDESDEVERRSHYAQGGEQAKLSMTEAGAMLVQRGATPGWFAAVLGIGRTTVNRKLSAIAPKRTFRNNTKLYDVQECLPYLVQPHDLKRHLMRMNPKDLPENLKREFWSARKLEQSVRKDAGELWPSEDVIAVFGELFKLIKNKATLWVDTVSQSDTLSNEQDATLRDCVDDLMSQIHGMVLKLESAQSTPSQLAAFGDDEDDNEEL